jgi:predicted RNA-binding Zn ribbon-like protein
MIQAFANTLGASPGADQLGTREEAAAWLRTAGLLPAEAGLSNSEHAALLRLRESMRDVLAAHTAGREDAANLVAVVAIAVAGSAASGAWLRFKSCSAAHCGQAFYDESGSAAARHCSAHASSP